MSKKKLIFRTLALGLLLSMGYGIFFIGTALPIISGYNAKILCSCVMVTGRSADDVIQNELSSALISLARSEVNFNDSSATSEVFGFAKRKAIYRKGLGCTLVNEITEEELRNQRFNLAQRPAINQDSILWPSGNLFTEISIEGLDFEKVNKVVEEAFEEPGEEKTRRTRAILIVYRNQVIAEKYAKGYGPHTKMMGWSMAKSITNAMTGILVKQGKLSIHEPAPISEWENDERSKITLHHLLQASSGLDWEEIYAGPSDATNMLFKKRDAGKFALNVPLKDPPGEDFYYSSGTTNIIQRIIRNTTGEDTYHSFPYKELFYKLGMYDLVLEPDPSGTFVGSSFAYATARDWARFGLLYLHDGVWNQERILPEGWVKYTTTPAPGADRGEYGAQFWLNAGAPDNPGDRIYPDVPQDLFWADGFEGQNVFILPSKQLVIVKLSQSTGNYLDDNRFMSDLIGILPD